ncbi:Na(+)/H(+) antiporter subunit F1 [Salinicoccus albus]|uniref:Na(+)/H(+) antiporter subunit F1 n=1 Tax=Salinicoccus albus TaxID=418756 RepID=UPI00036EFB66|nr:Na(+)/H(+) antiporter subunit F1 [Salinicoccus albus]
MFHLIIQGALILLTISLVIFLIRAFIGPSLSDRVLGLDTLGMNLIAFVGLLMLLQDTVAYSDIALVLSILAFVGTVVLSKFIERGDLFERH